MNKVHVSKTKLCITYLLNIHKKSKNEDENKKLEQKQNKCKDKMSVRWNKSE